LQRAETHRVAAESTGGSHHGHRLDPGVDVRERDGRGAFVGNEKEDRR
jgi:hypothetical protein